MSTLEELQQVCAEFSQNFAALSAKHDALGKELEAERALRRKVEGQLATAAEEVSQYAEALKSQRDGAEEALQYKERYYATCVAVEHLKGRLEVAKKALAEKDEEHEADKEHLHAQMKDLLQRLDSNAADMQVKTLKDRIIQLEEQCALLSGNTIEEKERMMQQQLLSNATVRDLQSKVAAGEQKVRASEAEIAQLRGILRRCSDVQSEMTVSNERLEAEKNRTQIALEGKNRAIATLEKKLLDVSREAEDKYLQMTRAYEKQLKQLKNEVGALKEALDRKTEDLEREAEKLGEHRASLTRRLNSVREECHREVEVLQTSKNDALTELQRFKWKCNQDSTRLEEAQNSLSLSQQRCDGLERQLHELTAQIEAAAQKESFIVSEREQLKQTVATMQLRLSEYQAQLSSKEASATESDRLRLQLQYTEVELFETRRQLEGLAAKVKTTEYECEKKIKFMHKQLKSQSKKRADEMNLNEDLRRRLVAETVYNAPSRGVNPSSTVPCAAAAAATMPAFVSGAVPTCSVSLEAGAAGGGAVDVLEVLRMQSKQATMLQERLSALAR